VGEQTRGHVVQHGFAVTRSPRELTTLGAMPHVRPPPWPRSGSPSAVSPGS
jgi:hypothetical protein